VARLTERRKVDGILQPTRRRLRGYSFDPSLAVQMETAVVNRITFQVPWEEKLELGPVGNYVEVVDVDPASKCFYAPVDLNHPFLLAQDGLDPSEGNPKFHQQMVYAVVMTTIGNFEQALGRCALWSSRVFRSNGRMRSEPVLRLRVYPHALREANAYYSPEKKALLFGYFPASTSDPGSNLPGGTVFTCLSHDVVAHETTHALLDGLHPRFSEASNEDVLAFHEAFADIVALFQHFSFPEVLRHQIAKTRGDLASQNLLGQLAQQFGQATEQHGALRDALGGFNPETKRWEPKKPDPTEISRTFEPHDRGAILVAAIFDAFLSIYKSRIPDLLRIATGGSGVLPVGELNPDLVGRLAMEASKSAQHVLRMCIRALDYCPPVDITFGEYLRALITADFDVVPVDEREYRIAVIEAFRRRGIYPDRVRNLSEENLRWPDVDENFIEILPSAAGIKGLLPDWGLSTDRMKVCEQVRRSAQALHRMLLSSPNRSKLGELVGLDLRDKAPMTIERKRGAPVFEVHSVRPTYRQGFRGEPIIDLVIEVTQRRRGYFDPETQKKADKHSEATTEDFQFRGGATLLVDPESGRIRYRIRKNINDERRLERQRSYLTGPTDLSLHEIYFGSLRSGAAREPFSVLHSRY
jgi:hypothetical protein